MSDQTKQALCCICGTLRTCRRPRNHREENYWLRRPIDQDWHRETGDLKCDTCGRITTHAVLLPDNDLRDHAERLHLLAIGYFDKRLTDQDRDRIQKAWRQGLPRNPYVSHLWWTSAETEARRAGKTHLIAICKAQVPLPEVPADQRDRKSYDRDEIIKPKEFHDVEYEAPNTGLWWYEIQCTDCLLRSNAIAVDEQRKALKLKLIEAAADIDRLDVIRVRELLNQFSKADTDPTQ